MYLVVQVLSNQGISVAVKVSIYQSYGGLTTGQM